MRSCLREEAISIKSEAMKGPSHHKAVGMMTKFIASLFAILALDGSMKAIAWEPAYSEQQLDVINGQLEKWKQVESYTKVKDIFGDGDDELNRTEANQDAAPFDVMPNSFADERAAKAAGGHCDYVKNMTNKTCLFRRWEGQGAYIFVYDEDAAGKFVKTSVIAPPTWYAIASVELVDVFGAGSPKFILIEHEGGCGTGSEERIHWLLGWHNGAFHTVFRETAYVSNDGLGERTVYRLNYKFVKGKTPRIETQATYDIVAVTAEPHDFHSQWRDWLFWNEKDFSFYERRIQKENATFSTGWGNEFKFRQNIEKNRLKILDCPPLPKRGDIDTKLDKYWKRIRAD
jgi:hypothetical protein